MPYLTCPSCRLRTYVVSEGICPACGTALRRDGPPAGPRPASEDRSRAIRDKLALACRELAADAALLSEIRDGHEHVRWAAGDGGFAGLHIPLRDTFCERLLSGRIAALVPDTASEPELRDLPAARDIRAYVGVPIHTADARAYVLCCLAREVRPDLEERDVRFLEGLAASLRPLLEA